MMLDLVSKLLIKLTVPLSLFLGALEASGSTLAPGMSLEVVAPDAVRPADVDCLSLLQVSSPTDVILGSAFLTQADVIKEKVGAAKGNSKQLGMDLDGGAFDVDADLSTLTWEPKSISVILPCAEERLFAVKTVEAVFNNTPPDVLREIVVVDDGSKPPLSTYFTDEMQKKYKVKIVRHEETVGLIGSKKDGGDAASGDILVFFDCHVAPQRNWHTEFLQLIGQNWRRMVVPKITNLDIDTWTQRSAGGGMAKCYLTWDVDFKWFDSNNPYIPAISGGLLGLSKRWWHETGGYDAQMLGWGGENLDQSLRMWLCGGEIMAAETSQVAHMWRVGSDKRTKSKYKRVGDTNRNQARAAYAWYDDFTPKLGDFSRFKSRLESGEQPWYGNLSNLLVVKNRLQCRPFAWFLRRFSYIYEDSGMIPDKIFMMENQKTGKCLTYDGRDGTASTGSGRIRLLKCDAKNDRQYWHLGNKDVTKGGKCCSGLRAWNTDQCISGSKTKVCDISGADSQQLLSVNSQGLLQRGDMCMRGTNGKKVELSECGNPLDEQVQWSLSNDKVPIETRLYRKALADNPVMFQNLEKQLTEI